MSGVIEENQIASVEVVVKFIDGKKKTFYDPSPQFRQQSERRF